LQLTDERSRLPTSYSSVMRLFIGTKEVDQPAAPRYFNILDVDEQTLLPRALRAYQADGEARSGNMRNWGFAWHGEHLYAPNRAQGLMKYDRNLNTLATFPCPNAPRVSHKPEQVPQDAAQFDRPHQIACLDNRIFICDSGHNLLRVFDIDSGTFRSVGFDARRNWINSINLINGEITVVFHNHGWSDMLALDMELKPRYEKSRIGVCAHHVWSMGGERWTCSSLEGRLRSIDSPRVVEIGGYPRGVAMFNQLLIIGVSRTRASASLPPGFSPQAIANSSRPAISTSGLVFLDMHTLAVRGTIEFQGLANNPEYQMPYLFELRVLDVCDAALHTSQPLKFGNIDRFLHLQRTIVGQ
jgi:hypothetical protein